MTIEAKYTGPTKDDLIHITLSYEDTKEFVSLGRILSERIELSRQSQSNGMVKQALSTGMVKQASKNLIAFMTEKANSGSIAFIRFVLNDDYLNGILEDIDFPMAQELLRHTIGDEIRIYLKMKWHL